MIAPNALLVAILGCSTPEVAAPAGPALVHPLASAPTSAWVQTPLFVAAPGEQIEDLVLADDPEEPVVTLVDASGNRRALRLSADGIARSAQVTLRPDAASRRSDTRGAQRVQIREGETTEVVLTRSDGTGSTVALRDASTRLLAFPSAGVGEAYVAEVGELGGVWRVTPEGVERIVPERAATRPVAWPAPEGGARIAYVQQGARPAVVLAAPVAAPLLEPDAALQAAGVPGLLSPVARSDQGFVRVLGCGADAPLALELDADGRARLGDLLAVPAERALACGEDCVSLLGVSDAGASRVLATLARADAGAWRVQVSPDGSGRARAPAWWMSSEAASGLPQVRSCLGAPDPARWLVQPLGRAAPGDRLTHADVKGDLLLAHGFGPKGRFVLTVTRDSLPLGQPTLRARPAPGDEVEAPDGGGTVAIVDGAVVQRSTDGQVKVLVPASDGFEPHEPAFSADGGALWTADRGSEPGLLRLDLRAGTGALVVTGAGYHAPLPARLGSTPGVAWVRERTDGWWVGFATPLSEGAAEAWDAGAVGLLGLEPDWVPVERTPAGWVRCTGGVEVHVGLGAGGEGELRWADRVVPVRAVETVGDRLRFLADDDGTPTVVAELQPDGAVATWWSRVDLRRGAKAWQPASVAKAAEGTVRCEAR